MSFNRHSNDVGPEWEVLKHPSSSEPKTDTSPVIPHSTGGALGGEVAKGKASEQAAPGRVCAECDTILSRYNLSDRCSLHSGARTSSRYERSAYWSIKRALQAPEDPPTSPDHRQS